MTLNMIVTRVKRQSVAVPDTSMCSKRILDGSQRNGDLNHNQMLHAHTIAVAIVRMQMHRVSASRMAMKASQWMIAGEYILMAHVQIVQGAWAFSCISVENQKG